MIFTVLGSGTSQGVPVIGCQCEVCTSSDPRDRRQRSALLVQSGDTNIAVDIGPDFRNQMLREDIRQLHGVLITHEHNDHVVGLDEIRPYNYQMGIDMPIYLEQRVRQELSVRFAYAFEPSRYPGLPEIRFNTFVPGDVIRIGEIEVEAFRVMHGGLPIAGFRFGDFAYVTDAKSLPEESMDILKQCRYVILNALHRQPHHAHMNLEEALALAGRLPAEKVWLTHMSHHLGRHREVEPRLPGRVRLAFDGLQIFC